MSVVRRGRPRPRRVRGPIPRLDERERARIAEILRRLATAHPDARCSLDFRSPLELLVATVLAAQCTDVRVNLVTKDLFRDFPTAADYAAATPGTLERAIHSTGFFRAKAKSLRGLGRALVERHDGDVPADLDALVRLPGVGRKTANVVLGTAFGVASGIVVDTHVARVSARLGLTRESDPGRIETDLMARIPREAWIDFAHRLIFHGRRICLARAPRCPECPLRPVCPSAALFPRASRAR